MKRLLLLAALMVPATWGADLTGKWTGVIEVNDASSGTRIDTPVRAEFSQKDKSVSGKIGRREDEQSEAIRNGVVEGDEMRFEVTSPETTGAINFNLKVVDADRLEGEMKGAIDSGPITGKVRLTRVK